MEGEEWLKSSWLPGCGRDMLSQRLLKQGQGKGRWKVGE